MMKATNALLAFGIGQARVRHLAVVLRCSLALIVLLLCGPLIGQSTLAYADSVRRAHQVPAIGYAVVTADGVLELEVLGVKQAGTDRKAERNDRFRIGSNTKLITAFIAARLVHDGRLRWDTRFFALFPE